MYTYVLLITMFINADVIEHRIIFPSAQECNIGQHYNVQLLDELSKTILTGYSTVCNKVTLKELQAYNKEHRETIMRQSGE